MAHRDQLEFFSTFSELSNILGGPLRVAEIGSLDINGTIRNIVKSSSDIVEYVGIDIGEGAGVDVVSEGHIFLEKNVGRFNVILSAECLEHNPFWRETIEQTLVSLATPGVLIFSWATTGRHVHGTHQQSSHSAPFVVEQWNSYYRNVSLSDLLSVKLRKSLSLEAIFVNHSHKDIYWVGVKGCEGISFGAIKSQIEEQRNKIFEINTEYLGNYKFLLQKSARARMAGILQRTGKKIYGSIVGKLLRKRSKLIFSNSKIIFPLIKGFKLRKIKRTQFHLFNRVSTNKTAENC
jgi:hypothetical protein